MNFYKVESQHAKWNAQRNLQGRTHYVDDETLRWHKSRVISAAPTDNGLLFCLIESCALDMHNTQRGFRYVIFDLFGEVLERPTLEQSFRTAKAARKAMYSALNGIDAKAHTLRAIDQQTARYMRDMADLGAKVSALG